MSALRQFNSSNGVFTKETDDWFAVIRLLPDEECEKSFLDSTCDIAVFAFPDQSLDGNRILIKSLPVGLISKKTSDCTGPLFCKDLIGKTIIVPSQNNRIPEEASLLYPDVFQNINIIYWESANTPDFRISLNMLDQDWLVVMADYLHIPSPCIFMPIQDFPEAEYFAVFRECDQIEKVAKILGECSII